MERMQVLRLAFMDINFENKIRVALAKTRHQHQAEALSHLGAAVSTETSLDCNQG
jgi:hypothetical protein